MNIKSLLLGSAAALAAVSGARAADAVVIAEPEPMEYVRICDVYGTGYYYIPGTETCLKIGGYVRYDIGGGDITQFAYASDGIDGVRDGKLDSRGDTYTMFARARLSLDARSETELGTLRALANMNFNFVRGIDGQVSNFGLNDAFIELGGFRVGKTDSYFTTFSDYGPAVINDDLGVPYGPFDTFQIAYTWTGPNGWAAGIALEDGGSTYLGSTGTFYAGGGHTLSSYAPDVTGGVSWTQGWGKVSVVAGYDSVVDAGAVKGRIDLNVTSAFTVYAAAAYSTNDPAGTGLWNLNANNFYANFNGSYAVWGGATFAANEKTKINGAIAYDEDENFVASANIAYTVVPGLTVTPEINYVTNFNAANGSPFRNALGGFLRFQRNF